jgi:hypothetical protein
METILAVRKSMGRPRQWQAYSIAESQEHTRAAIARMVEGTLPRLQGWLDAAAVTDLAGALALYRSLPPDLRRAANLRAPRAPKIQDDSAETVAKATECVDFLQGVALGKIDATDDEVAVACKALDEYLPDAVPLVIKPGGNVK